MVNIKEIIAALPVIIEMLIRLGIIPKTDEEKFRAEGEKIKKEWKQDEQDLLEALQVGDLTTINRISAKWSLLLSQA